MLEAILDAGEPRKIFELIKRNILWILVEKRDLLHGFENYQELNCIFNFEILTGCDGS